MDDARIEWMKEIVLEGLGALPKAFDYMLSEPANKAVILNFLENRNETQPHPAIIFHTMQMDPTLARLVHGRLSSDPEEGEEEETPPTPPGEPEELEEGVEGAPSAEEGAPADAADAATAAPAAEAAAAAPTADNPEDAPANAPAEASADGEASEPAAGDEQEQEEQEPPKATPVERKQDPAELLGICVCLSNDLPAATAAGESSFVYFSLLGVGEDEKLEAVPASGTAEAFAAAIDYGVINGGSIMMLEQVMQEVYLPLVTNPSAKDQLVLTTVEAQQDNIEFLSNLHKFASQLQHAIQQVTGDFRLNMPQITIDDANVAADDEGLVMQLEEALADWTPAISSALETQMAKQPIGKGPLAEIEHWRARNAALSTLCEQLNTPNARKMLEVLEKVESQLLPGFKYQYSELEKRYIEAKDNVKFLTTLERHFKHITNGTLVQILDTLPSMMNALRMVWVISRHYKDDHRMEPLMARIAWEVANRVSTMINMRTIFREPAARTIKLISEAHSVLEKWEHSYMDTRKMIEESGRDNRWEFDRNKLFARTRYMALRCTDLLFVAEMLRDMRAMLGPELKAVTGDAKGIDEVMSRVEALVVPLETAPFDLFDRRYQTSWEAAMGKFRENVAAIEEMLKKFMDDSFTKLRSAEGAFDLLQKFRSMQSHEASQKLMERKTVDILSQYEKELAHVNHLFETNRDNPPLSKNQPPLAGSINWSHSLFLRVRKTIAKFQSMDEDLFSTEQGKEVSRKFVQVSKAIRRYEKSRFEDWKETVNSKAMQLLKQPIFRGEGSNISVNFHEELVILIRESKYLDRMGFAVPETALNVTLQEDKYHSYVESLNAMLQAYRAVLDSLSPVETELLRHKINELRSSLDKGWSLLNWNSLSIPEFTESCMKAINSFQTILKQIQKNAFIIKGVVDAICNVELLKCPAHTAAEVPDMTELNDEIERHRQAQLDELKRQYTQIGPLLIKVEEMVVNSNSGRSPRMAAYYSHWEQQIFAALTKMVITALTTCYELVSPHLSESKHKKPVALFKVSAILLAPDVHISPPLTEALKFIDKLVASLVESTKAFVRWMHGTCVETPPQVSNNEDEEMVTFSFFFDIVNNQEVKQLRNLIKDSVKKTFGRVNKHLKQYSVYETLWKMDKAQHLTKFEQKNPTCVQFDSRLQSYSRVIQDTQAMPGTISVDFMEISVSSLLHDIQEHAKAWVTAIAKLMNQMFKQDLVDLHELILDYSSNLDRSPDTLDDLKFILNMVAEISSRSMDMEMRYSYLEEVYRTLRMYQFEVPEDEADMVDNMRIQWAELCEKAKVRDRALVKVKKQFTLVTEGQVIEFQQKVQEMYDEFISKGPGSGVEVELGMQQMEEYHIKLGEFLHTREELGQALKLFNLPIMAYPQLSEVEQSLKDLGLIYNVFREQQESRDEWSSTLWSELEMSVMEKGMEDFDTRLKRMPKPIKSLRPYKKVEDVVNAFVASLPLIQNLKNDALRDRHWRQLMEVTGISFDMNPKTFTLQKLFEMQLDRFEDAINDICSGAAKELTIETGINQITDTWRVQRFEVVRYMKGTQERGLILRSTDEIQQTLEDQMMNLSSMMSSRYVSPFIDITHKWEKLMSTIAEVIEVWMKVQAKWMYLEAIFIGSEDIRLQLPEEAKRFDRIHTTFRKIMTETQKNPNVLDSCTADGRLDHLAGLFSQLEACQKSLSDYLETKRTAFPRFYFLSDDELLQILGTSDPTAVQEHMLKLFDNTAALTFDRSGAKVLGMVSSEKESFPFNTLTLTEGAVESWLYNVEAEMMKTLHAIHKRAVFHYPTSNRLEWLKDNLGMVVNTGSQIWWTYEVADIFIKVRHGDKLGMKRFARKCASLLDDLIVAVRDTGGKKTTTKKINCLVIIDVHARDIIDSFVRDSVLDEREFAWESQLRFSWDRDEDDVKIRQCSGVFDYGYEYQGLNGRLVITPLTDRCYMTCTQSLHYRLGCAPAGPAGTGKTETVKDLSKAMSVQCKVFCCGEGLDYKAMGCIFSGLVQTGAWGCFDEFNRIPVEVLSVVSAQIKTIQTALADGVKKFSFEGREVNLVPTVGIYITMNPGYAGRAELPDNLKALFRPVVMVLPNLAMICENMLMSEGFGKSKLLAKKMTVLYKLGREQLSKQYHYDFGLRALKSVLVMAGSLKRASPEYDESTILMRALRDMNMPKFIFADVPLFRGLINDLFPGLDCPRVRYPSFNDACEQAMTEQGLELLELQLDKVVQLYETMMTRHTTMIVGPTGGGKTVCLGAMCRAQILSNLPTKQFIINPKAIPISELYGELDPVTRDWTDGLLSNIFRDMNKPVAEGREERRYIVYDGDVDAVWVENMNSVMDDNKLLTLPNGERIRLNFPTCSMLFEVFDLQYASPATISRCGMVYVDPKDLGWKPYWLKWLNSRDNQAEVDHLRSLGEKYLDKCIDFVVEGIEDKASMTMVEPPRAVQMCTNIGLIQQLCVMLSSQLTEARNITEPSVIEAVFLLAISWSLGGPLSQDGRVIFHKFLSKMSGLPPGGSDQVSCGQMPASLPTLHDFYLDIEMRKWKPWSSEVAPYEPPPDRKFSSIMVPTSDTVRSTWILEAVASVNKGCLFVGESGTAKTTVVAKYLQSRDATTSAALSLNFSSRTSSKDVQIAIEDALEKRTKDTFGPPAGKKLTIFVDDLNMPRVDTYGTQQPVALLKLLADKGYLYDRGKDLTIKYIKDVQFTAAMVPGRNDVDPRFIRLFNVFCVTFPPEESIKRIYATILETFFDAGPFPSDLKGPDLAGKLTTVSMNIFNAIVQALPPTPAKFHYIFNLRDLSRITEGVMQATPDKVRGVPDVVRQLRHEVLRVFHDRLVNHADRDFVSNKIEECLKMTFPEETPAAMVDPILFGDFANYNLVEEEKISGSGDSQRLYEDLKDFASIKPVMEEVLEKYNMANKAMNLVLFDDCLGHLVRVHRLMRLPRANALLVGVGGSGKQSITRLSAFTAGADVFTITLTRGYNEVLFRDDIKSLYQMIATKPVAFLFTDQHVAEEGFLELINNMLTAGMVPALYEEAERDGIINGIRDEAVKRGALDTKEGVWTYFVNKCRDNLHVVLAMSPVGETLRVRCRSFPGMVNNTVIDWFVPWPEQALISVAGVFLADEDLPETARSNIVSHMVMVHNYVTSASDKFEVQLKRHNYVTPKNYLDFISNYRSVLKEERRKIDQLIQRLDGGLSKLVQAATEVDAMSVKLQAAQIEVSAKSEEVKTMLEEISASTSKAEERQVAATQKEAELEEESVKITQEKAEAEAALEEALPALEEAAQALQDLKKEDISELRSFAKPHPAVQDVCLCVVILKGGKDVSWKGAKAMMSDTGFLRSLVEFDKDSLSEKQIKAVRSYFSQSFTPEEVRNISQAGAGLLKWVFAIVNYYGVAKTVDPKRKAVAAGEKALRTAQKELSKIQAEVQQLSQQLLELKEKYERGSQEEKDLSEKAETMERRLTAASKLIAGLGSERTRWTADMETLHSKREVLVGDCLLAAAFLSYTGAFNFEFRQTMIVDVWEADIREKAIQLSDPFMLTQTLTSDVETARWASEGLPADELSVQNGILTTRSSRYPLCIDPQQQAVAWIKKRESKSSLRACTFNDSDFLKHLEIAVNLGFAFLFENVDEYIDPIIDPVLEKNLVKKGNTRTVKIGDKDVEWDDSFRLYLTSKLSNPHYGPETFGKAMIINYSVTQSGLEDQLLNEVVRVERADLAEQKVTLVTEVSELSGMLKELEDTLLYELANSTGNILDNGDLIETLEQTKTKAVEISEKLEEAKSTAVEIDATCAAYRPVAKRGSILFFVMSSLATLNNMYELSLALYMVVFLQSLRRAEPDSNVELRLENIVATLTADCYAYTCRGIFETHKLMFSLQMTLQIQQGDGMVDRDQLDFFLKGNLALEKCKDPPPADFMSDTGWHDMQRLKTMNEGKFANLPQDIKDNYDEWKSWYDLEAPESYDIPCGYEKALTPMEKLLVLRCFRVDRIYVAITKFIIVSMGQQYVQPPVLEYSAVYEQSTNLVPVIFVLSPGADPATDIFKLANQLGMGGAKMKFMALGQGQGPVAQAMLEQGSQRGHWVMLQNCHLLPSWLKTLEKLLEQNTSPQEDFRLWCTTDPTEHFPIGILQRSIKVVTEPPNGLRLNMLASYSKVTEDALAHCPHPAFRSCVFVLSFFHAVVQERRKYGKVGWNVKYDFNDSDFAVSLKLLENYLTKAHNNGDTQIPWDTLRYLVGEVMYGGRVTDDCDRRVVETYMQEYLGDFLFDTFQPFHFYQDEESRVTQAKGERGKGVDYAIPPTGPRDIYMKAIEALPGIDSQTPEVFGLHPNAEIDYLTNASKKLWRDLIDLQPRAEGAGGGISREEYITNIASDIESKQPTLPDLNKLRKDLEADGFTPVFVVLVQELERWETLNLRMTKSLRQLKKALIGEIAMSNELDALGVCLFNGMLPDMWRKLTPQTDKMLGSWMTFHARRHVQYKSWIDEGEPKVMWLSGLGIPETYTAALVQTTCRRYGWPLDKSTLYTKVTQYSKVVDVPEKLKDGCYVTGLYIEGAAWDVENRCLMRQPPKVLVQELPILQIIPVELNKLKLHGTIRIPMYITQQRRNAMGVGMMMEADLDTKEHPSLWILQGTALVLNTDS